MNPQTKTLALDRWRLPLRNDAGETIPAFACVKIEADAVSPGDEIFYGATQPSTGDEKQCVFNGPISIPDDPDTGKGLGTDLATAVALYDAAGGADPIAGDEWGPITGSWAIQRTGKGFTIIGGVDTDTSTVHVLRKGGAGGAGKKTAIVKATANVPAATGDRAPGASSAFDMKLGDDISGNQVENWSLTEISTDSYLAIVEVIDDGESHYVIYNAFC